MGLELRYVSDTSGIVVGRVGFWGTDKSTMVADEDGDVSSLV